MAVDWTRPLVARNGRRATLKDRCPSQDAVGDPRRRVEVPNHDPKSYTTWLVHEDGHTRGDGAESEHDILNAA